METKNITKLTAEEKLMICTVYGESAGSSPSSWQAISNVIMNRVGNREWSSYKTVTDVIKYSGFDAYTNNNSPYNEAVKYLNNRDGTNKRMEECITVVMGVYRGQISDNTNGAVLYYSPRAQLELYGKQPDWNFKLLTEVKVQGV